MADLKRGELTMAKKLSKAERKEMAQKAMEAREKSGKKPEKAGAGFAMLDKEAEKLSN
mgnify:CR=1 FL=1